MPKYSTSTRHASRQDQDGQKIEKVKHRSHHYRDAAKARKLKQTRIKGLVEEVVAPVKPGKARPLRREPKLDWAKIERKMRSKHENTQPVSTPAVPAEVYGLNPVDLNVPRIIVPISEATAMRRQAAAGDDDGDTTDVDDSEDVVVVPAGFVEVAENLGLLSASAASDPREKVEAPPSAPPAQPDEKPPTTERLSTRTETPSSGAAPQTTSSAPSPFSPPSSLPSNQPLYVVPDSVSVEAVCNDSQTATTRSPTHLESSELSAPFAVPQATPVPESFQEAAWPSSSPHPTSVFWDNNINDAQTFNFHRQDIQNGSTSGDVNMEFLDTTEMEPPVHPLSTMWASPQPQPGYQSFYSHIGQNAYNNVHHQTYTMNNIYPNWASTTFQPMQNEFVQQSIQINQPPFDYAVDPFTAASYFWTALSGSSGTAQSATTVPDITKSTPTRDDEPQSQEEPSKLSLSKDGPKQEESNQRRYRPDNDGGFHRFPNLRSYRNMRLINMSGELEESRIIRPMPGYRRFEKPPLGSEMDMINHLRMKAQSQPTPQISKVEHRKRQRQDSQLDSTHTSNDSEVPPRQRRRREPDTSKLKAPVPSKKKSRKLHQQHEALPKGPTPSEWDFSRFWPSISSLADRLFKKT